MINRIEFWTPSVLGSIVYVLAGLLIMVYPAMTATLFIDSLAILAIIYAIYLIYGYFRKDGTTMNVIMAVLMIVSGAYAYFNTAVVTSILPAVAGTLLILDGTVRAFSAFKVYKNTHSGLISLIISVIFPIIFGITMLVYPLTTLAMIVSMFGMFLILIGIIDVIGIVMMNRAMNY